MTAPPAVRRPRPRAPQIAFWDKAAFWTDRVGDWLSTPWHRMSRYCYERWRRAGGPQRDWKRP